jgi:hypothetical protein
MVFLVVPPQRLHGPLAASTSAVCRAIAKSHREHEQCVRHYGRAARQIEVAATCTDEEADDEADENFMPFS